jgi:HlyD family secretion protein
MDRPLPPGRRRNRRILAGAAIALGVAVLALLVATLLGGVERTIRVPRQTVTIDTAATGLFHDFTPLRGQIAPHDTVYLDALEGGQVSQVLAHAGDRVTAGQPLLTFRNTELELDVLDRVGRLVESITQLQTYEKDLEDTRLANAKAAAEIDYNITRLNRAAERRLTLAATGVISQESEDQIRDELAYDQGLRPLQAASDSREDALRVRQLPAVHEEESSLRQDLVITRAKLDDLTVKAPVAGELTDLVQNVGENHNRGERLGEIVPDTGFKVTATVDEFYLARVRVGQMAQADIDGRTWTLKVTRVYPQVKDGVFSVDLDFVGPPPQGLTTGEAVDGKLSLGGDAPAVILPAGAFLERTGGDWAMVMVGANRAERRRISVGRRNAEQVEVLSGLKPGDRVITSDYTAFERVDRVELTN